MCCAFGKRTTRCTQRGATSGWPTTKVTVQSERCGCCEQVFPSDLSLTPDAGGAVIALYCLREKAQQGVGFRHHQSWYVHLLVYVVPQQLFQYGNTWCLSTAAIKSRGARLKRIGRRNVFWRKAVSDSTKYSYTDRQTGIKESKSHAGICVIGSRAALYESCRAGKELAQRKSICSAREASLAASTTYETAEMRDG
eukprot:6186469-Pleurochrysis_carterae.AAC.1